MPCIPNMVLSHHLPIGMELGDIAIGQTLLEVGSTFQKIGMLEREYLGDVYNKFFKPFNSHLQVEFNLLVTVDPPIPPLSGLAKSTAAFGKWRLRESYI